MFLSKKCHGLQSLLTTTFNSFRGSVTGMSSPTGSKNCFRCSVVVAFLAFCILIRIGRVASSFVASTTEMSVWNNWQSDYVLYEIFLILDVPDFLSCTKVCRKWRCVIESLVLGKRFFQRLKKSSAAWRRAWRKLAQDETNLKPEDYKNICWSCLRYLEQVDGNWRTGSYKLKTSRHSIFPDTVYEVGEDFITACDYDFYHVKIFDRELVEVKREFGLKYQQYKIIDVNTVVYPQSKGLTFYDTKTGQLIRRFKLNESPSRFDACCPTAKLWTVVANLDRVLQLDLLRMDNASNVALVKTIEVARFGHYKFQVDEQFILHQKSADYRQTIHFISTGIVHDTVLERPLSVMPQWWFRYDRGLMFIINSDNLIRILDVVSGTYLHDIDMGIWVSKYEWIKAIKANLNYVVIIAESNLYVYSLQALRNPLPSDAFVSKTQFCYESVDLNVMVDETQIVCLGTRRPLQIAVFDFGSFELKPNITLSAPSNEI